MIIAYYDEAGDDGYPKYSSPLFVLSALYLHYQNWKSIYQNLYDFRKFIKHQYGIPIKCELHTRQLLLNKNPYRKFYFTDKKRLELMDHYCEMIASLDWKFINVVINKKKISKSSYDVLDRAFTYSIQRIENDLSRIDPSSKFMIITDEGRIGKMRRVSRKIQRINYIPSLDGYTTYRREIEQLIEDPLPKDSKQSYFIQTVDMVACIVYMHKLLQLGVAPLSNRSPAGLNHNRLVKWIEILKPSLNLAASSVDPYGIVCYPK
jgi:hypothetical protein